MTASRGRPPVGPRITVRLPVALVDKLDIEASRREVARAELVRRIIVDALER